MKIELLGYWLIIQKKPIRDEEGKFVSPNAIAKQRTTDALRVERAARDAVACDYNTVQSISKGINTLDDAVKNEEFGR